MDRINIVYISLRLVSSALALSVCVVTIRFVRSSLRTMVRQLLGLSGASMLGIAGILALYDGIDHAILRPGLAIDFETWLWFGLIGLILPVYGWLLIGALRDRDGLVQQLQDLGVTDLLTGAFNRRGFGGRAATSVAQARRAHQPSVIPLIDLDRSKLVNDTHGHDAGDALLRVIVTIIKRELRDGDLVGRFGGDEFVALILGGDVKQVSEAITRVVAKIKTEITSLAGGATVGFSCGVAFVADSGESVSAIEQAMGHADSALYDAKRGRRGRIVISQEPLSKNSVHTTAQTVFSRQAGAA